MRHTAVPVHVLCAGIIFVHTTTRAQTTLAPTILTATADVALAPATSIVLVDTRDAPVRVTLPPAVARGQWCTVIVRDARRAVTVEAAPGDSIVDPDGARFMGGAPCANGELVSLLSLGERVWYAAVVQNSRCARWRAAAPITARIAVDRGAAHDATMRWDTARGAWVGTMALAAGDSGVRADRLTVRGALVLPALSPGVVHADAGGTLGTGTVALGSETGGTLPVERGGTNSTTPLHGWSVMLSDGNGIVQGPAGTTTQVLHGNAANAPAFGKVALASDVSGTLATTHGGTGASRTFTPGSVIIAAAGGAFAEDNGGLSYDAGARRLGVGTNAPRAALEVAGDVYVNDATRGLILRDAAGKCFRVGVGEGALTLTPIACP